MAAAYPLGAGHRGTAVLSPKYLDPKYLTTPRGDPTGPLARASHNTFMTALVEQGVPGAILFVWLWIWCLRTVVRVRRGAKGRWPPAALASLAGVGAALAVVFVAGQFVDYLKAEIYVWLLAILASMDAIRAAPTTAAATAPSNGDEAHAASVGTPARDGQAG
jgi:hypothetical protein